MKNWVEHEKYFENIRKMVRREMFLVEDVDFKKDVFPFVIPKPMKRGTVCKVCQKNKAHSRHHLVPKGVWRLGDKVITVPTCKYCHKDIHRRFDNLTLKNHYNTPRKLRGGLM